MYTYYGSSAVLVLQDNPYTLLRIAPDMTFATADTLANQLGIPGDDERRLEAALNWILRGLDDQGHTCLPVDELIGKAVDVLKAMLMNLQIM